MLDYAGQPVPGAFVGSLTGDSRARWHPGRTLTDSYALTGVPALADTGQLWMVAGPEITTRSTSAEGSRSSTPAPPRSTSGPGRLPLSICGGDRGLGDQAPRWPLGSKEASPDLETDQYPSRWDRLTPTAGYAYGLPGDYTSAVVTFHGGGWPSRLTEALEIEMPQGAPAVVQSGQTGAVSLVADEGHAARAEVTRWASGAAGQHGDLEAE